MTRVLSPSHRDVLAPAATVAALRQGPARRHPLVWLSAIYAWVLVAMPMASFAEELYLDLDHGHESFPSRELNRIHEEINPAHLTVLDIKLKEFTQQAVESRLGRTRGYLNKSGHHTLMVICYRSDHPGDNTKVLFGADEHNMKAASFRILSDVYNLKGSAKCTRTPLVFKELATASGLKLGMSQDQVKSLLGGPSKENKDRLIYSYDFKRQLTKEEMEKFYPCEDEYVYAWVDAKFMNSRLISLLVSVSDEAGDSCSRSGTDRP